MAKIYLDLFLCALLPVAVSVGFFFLGKTNFWKKIPSIWQQIIIGIIFGGIAIFGTEFGVPIGTATANVRDAAPICAGLIFGGPAGIIAGVIGGVERFFAAYWGKGAYSQIACSISTILAGLYAAALRKWMFDNKRPSWGFALATGVVMEAIHLTILLITKMDSTAQAVGVLKLVGVPMIIMTALSIGLACLALDLIEIEKTKKELKSRRVSTRIQLWLLGVTVLAFIVTTAFVDGTQNGSAVINATSLMENTINDVDRNIFEESDNKLLKISADIVEDYQTNSPTTLDPYLTAYDISEINIVDKDGYIVKSTVQSYVDDHFQMSDPNNAQAYDFHTKILEKGNYVQSFQPQSFTLTGVHSYIKYAGVTIQGGGYIQIGLSSDKFVSSLEEKFGEMTKYRHVGKTGFILILDSADNIVSTKNAIEIRDIREEAKVHELNTINLTTQDLKLKKPNTYFERKCFDTDCAVMYEEVDAFYIVTFMPTSEVFETRDAQIFINSFMEVIVFAVLFAVIYFLIKFIVVNNIVKINGKLDTIVAGDLNVKVDNKSSVEFESLSNGINYTVDALKVKIEQEATRIDEELAFAKTIQLNALQNVWPAFPDFHQFDIYATMKTAKEVGGDFYDMYVIDKNHIGITMADVSGKGIPAAMFMMESKTMLRNFARTGYPVDQVLINSNDGLCQGNEANMFVTCWLAVLDIRTGVLQFANAGHNYPIVYRKDKGWEIIKQKKNFVLGGMPGMHYDLQEIQLNPGDRIYLYTDGVTEATRGDGALFGEERLVNCLNNNIDKNDKDLLASVQVDIDEFIEGADQFDDITMLALDYIGN